MRRAILFAVALPLVALAARKLATGLSSHGHEKAGSRVQQAADLIRRNRRR